MPFSNTAILVIYMPFSFIYGAINPWVVLWLLEICSLQDKFLTEDQKQGKNPKP